MKFLFDSFPTAVFFAAYYIAACYIPKDVVQHIFFATAAAIAAVIIQVSIYWLLYRRVEYIHLANLVIILILGGSTLVTQDKRFFLWKPTVVSWLFALVCLVSEFIGSKNIVQRIMEHTFNRIEHTVSMPARVWVNLNRGWVLFFLFLGGMNLYIAFNFSEHVWVNFKMFGILGLTVLFGIIHVIYLSSYISELEDPHHF